MSRFAPLSSSFEIGLMPPASELGCSDGNVRKSNIFQLDRTGSSGVSPDSWRRALRNGAFHGAVRWLCGSVQREYFGEKVGAVGLSEL